MNGVAADASCRKLQIIYFHFAKFLLPGKKYTNKKPNQADSVTSLSASPFTAVGQILLTLAKIYFKPMIPFRAIVNMIVQNLLPMVGRPVEKEFLEIGFLENAICT